MMKNTNRLNFFPSTYNFFRFHLFLFAISCVVVLYAVVSMSNLKYNSTSNAYQQTLFLKVHFGVAVFAQP